MTVSDERDINSLGSPIYTFICTHIYTYIYTDVMYTYMYVCMYESMQWKHLYKRYINMIDL